jgi:aromatic-L-amino-acid decarboxylase
MFVADPGLITLILEYCRRRLELDPVPLDRKGDAKVLQEALRGLVKPGPSDPAEALRLFSEVLAPAVISSDSPRFLAFIPAAPTKASLLFDMVVSCSSLQGTSWLEASGAVAAENQVLSWLADLAGLPGGAGGCFVSGGSAGNLSALVVARETARRTRARAERPPRVAVSDQAHSSLFKALMVAGMEPLVVRSPGLRLDGAALEAALRADAHPDDVVAVCATAGTTNAGLVDDLSSVGEVAKRWGLWYHVDAAYGGAALLSRTERWRFAGIEQADSIVVDPHKWLFAPFDSSALIYRQPQLAKAVHTQDASYLDVIHEGAPEEWNPSDYAYHLSRRARGLPMWFSLVVNGTEAYRDAVDAAIVMARRSAELVKDTDYLELVVEPELSVLLFRRTGWSAEAYESWSARILEEQVAFVTPTKWQGETVARLVFLHPRTTLDIVREVIASMR